MPELNFCPFCDAPRHKVAIIKDDLYFCKECNHFFNIKERHFQCFKCNSQRWEDSDFPTPDGEMVIQCRKCKKMYSVTDFLQKNEEVNG